MSMGGMLSCLKKETSPFKECKVRPRHVPSHVSAPRATASQQSAVLFVDKEFKCLLEIHH